MSVKLLITVEATNQGVAIQSILIQDGDELEMVIAATMNIGIRATEQYIMQALSKAIGEEAIIIEGEKVDKAIAARLRSIDAFDPKPTLRKMGYKLKGDQ